MCGLFGIVAQNIRAAEIVSPVSLIRSRGPDDVQMMARDWFALGFTRLAIMSVENGKQPVISADGDIVLAFNGEIYNFDFLIRRYDISQQACEADLLLALYIRFGSDFTKLIDGDFSIAVFQQSDKSCHLFRDPVGVKPLYYTPLSDGRWAFSSAVCAFFAIPGFSCELDPIVVQERIVLGFWSENKTCFRTIRQCPPGSCVVLSAGSPPSVRDAAQPLKQSRLLASPDPIGSAVQQTTECLRAAVAKRVRHSSHFPVVMSLSGGIDSTLMTTLATQDFPSQVSAITIADRPYTDDVKYSCLFTAAANIPHFVYNISIDEFKRDFAAMVLAQGTISSSYSGYQIAKAVRFRWPEAKVLLMGEGADEIFLGYSIFTDFREYLSGINTKLARVPKEIIESSELLSRVRYWGKLSLSDIWIDLIQIFQRDQLVNSHLLGCDHGPMAHGIECRVPYLDTDLISIAAEIPPRIHSVLQRPKTLLRLALATALQQHRGVAKQLLARQTSPAFMATNGCRQWLSQFVKAKTSVSRFRHAPLHELNIDPAEKFWIGALIVIFQDCRGRIDGLSFEDLTSAIFES
ncbi:asparagine synthase-related protein [Mesorhizobium australicum]|uniref:asparagine synthetase B family protein n=1 Tax=Mesorhizobium australicum TaxID=536018 RepID=UPI00333713F2